MNSESNRSVLEACPPQRHPNTSQNATQAVLRIVCVLIFGAWTIFVSAAVVMGQEKATTVRIGIESLVPAKLRVSLEMPNATTDWSFRNTYAGIIGLGTRISDLEGLDSNQRRIVARNVAPGEFRTSEKSQHVLYSISVDPPSRPTDSSHVSWLTKDRGLLMLSDILPEGIGQGSITVELTLPAGWKALSNAKRFGAAFIVNDPDKTVILVGHSLREKRTRTQSTELVLMTDGKWPFTDEDAVKAASRMIREYSDVTRFSLSDQAFFTLLPFPSEVRSGKWTAETRGNNLVLLLDHKAPRRQLLPRLGVILSHEVFHYWIPNSLSFEGNYDWFFEGFTLYLALRTALNVELIDFEEYLATLGRVYDSYRAAVGGDDLSLIDLSERRWTSFPTLVYDKGMLVAFLYDLQLRKVSGGRSSLSEIYKEIFRQDYSKSPDANEAILSVLRQPNGMQDFPAEYIEKARPIDLENVLQPYGIKVERPEFQTRLTVLKHVDEPQRRLLRTLGYRG